MTREIAAIALLVLGAIGTITGLAITASTAGLALTALLGASTLALTVAVALARYDPAPTPPADPADPRA